MGKLKVDEEVWWKVRFFILKILKVNFFVCFIFLNKRFLLFLGIIKEREKKVFYILGFEGFGLKFK